MGKMKDLDIRLTGLEDRGKTHTVQLEVLSEHLCHLEERLNKRLDVLLQKIEVVESKIDGQIKMLLDRIVEMSMIQQGQSGEANVHRAQARLENNFSSSDAWTPEELEKDQDVWPPPGADVMDVRG